MLVDAQDMEGGDDRLAVASRLPPAKKRDARASFLTMAAATSHFTVDRAEVDDGELNWKGDRLVVVLKRREARACGQRTMGVAVGPE